MKNLIIVTICIISLCLGEGCKSTEQVAYHSIGTISFTVDKAMLAWGDYVRSGKAKPEEEIVIRDAYEKYQASMKVAKVTILSMKNTSVDKSKVDIMLSALEAAAASISTFIAHFIHKPVSAI